MRNAYYEYYGLSKDEYEHLWSDALVVFDTNVLLSLYRLQLEARSDLLSAMNSFKDRLWMPFQVGYEYHERRLEEACRPIEALQDIKNKVSKFVQDIEKDCGKNPYIRDYKTINRSLKSLGDKINKHLEESLDGCPNFMHEDVILLDITKLYEGKVGVVYNNEQLSEIFKTGEDRYSKKIPPGFKDTGKKTGDRHRFGDLIIWFQIIEKSKNDDCDIIFVTDEKKEDWWQLYNGDKIGPRRELITEFRKETGGHLIGFYTPDRFLSIANERKAVSVKKKTIEEVKCSDKIGAALEAVLGESSLPGQVSTGSLRSSSLGVHGESGIGNFSLMTRSDRDNLSISGIGATAFDTTIGSFETSTIKPGLRKPGRLETTPPIPETGTYSQEDVSEKDFEKLNEEDKDREDSNKEKE